MTTERNEACQCCGYEEPRVPWHVDEEKAAVVSPDLPTTDTTHRVRHRYKDIHYSTPNHKEWAALPDEVLFRVSPVNPRRPVEHLSLFFQAVMGPPAMLNEAATRFLNTLTWTNQPENEQLAGIANALDHILASNGQSAGTISVARTETAYPDAREPVYVRFQQDVADTSVDVPRYSDDDRVEARDHTLDLGLLRSARRIQAVATSRPVEVELALESYGAFGGGGDLGIGLEIRHETTLDELYRQQHSPGTEKRGEKRRVSQR